MKKRSLGAKPLIYPQPVLLIATFDNKGKANVMNAAWGGIASSDPLCVSVGVRPSRHTHDAIISRNAFTVNIPSQRMVQEADFVGMVSGRNLDKFVEAGFTPITSDVVDAPYISQCPVVLECALLKTVNLEAHTLMIGEILDAKVDEDCLMDGDVPDIHKIAPLVFDSGSRRYFSIGQKVADAFSVGMSRHK